MGKTHWPEDFFGRKRHPGRLATSRTRPTAGTTSGTTSGTSSETTSGMQLYLGRKAIAAAGSTRCASRKAEYCTDFSSEILVKNFTFFKPINPERRKTFKAYISLNRSISLRHSVNGIEKADEKCNTPSSPKRGTKEKFLLNEKKSV